MLGADERHEIRREVVRQTWPVVLQYFFRTLMFLVDTIMIKEVGTDAMATMGIVGPITYTLIMLMTALSAGTIATVARAWGAGDHEKQRQAGATSLLLAGLLSIPMVLLGVFVLPTFVQMFSPPDNPSIGVTAGEYLVILSFALPFFLADFSAGSVLRAAGDSRTPMILAVGANVLNVALNYVLIFGKFGAPEMGVKGAAVASAISIALQGALTAGFLTTRWSRIRILPSALRRVTADSMRSLLRIMGPALIEPIILQSGFLIYIKFITLLGGVSLAAHRAAIAVESLSFMPGYAVSIACGAIVGQYLGAQRADKAEAGFGESMKIGVGIMMINAVLFLAIPQILLWPFAPADLPEPARQAAVVLRIACLEQPFMAMAMVLSGALRGAGDTRSPAILGAVGTWAVRVPVSYLLAIVLGLGLTGIWITMVLDWSARTVLGWWVWRRGRWKQINL